MIETYEELKSYINTKLDIMNLSECEIKNALIEFEEQQTGVSNEVKAKSDGRITIKAFKEVLKHYDNLSYSDEQLQAVVSEINKCNLSMLEVNNKLQDISNSVKFKGKKDDLKAFTIRCIHDYYEKKIAKSID